MAKEKTVHDADKEIDLTQPRTGKPSVEAAENAARKLLLALGADLNDPVLSKTPERMAKSYAELLTPIDFDMTTFPNDQGYDEMIIAKDVQFHSLCEHHLLPFIGVAYVAYIPRDRILGISKLARVVEKFARGLQVQERLTVQIANFIQEELDPKGVGVVLSAEHTCMSLRGVKACGTQTVTSSLKGLIRDSDRTRAEFFSLINE